MCSKNRFLYGFDRQSETEEAAKFAHDLVGIHYIYTIKRLLCKICSGKNQFK